METHTYTYIYTTCMYVWREKKDTRRKYYCAINVSGSGWARTALRQQGQVKW